MIRPGIPRSLRLPFTRARDRQRDVDAEIALHLELCAAELVRRGVPPDAARDEALRRFGSPYHARRDLERAARRRDRKMNIRESLSSASADLRFAIRQLRRTPVVTAVIVATLAIGIGANATMFGIVDLLLLRPPAFVRAPEQLVRIQAVHPPRGGDPNSFLAKGWTQTSFPYVSYAQLAVHSDLFSSVAAYASPQRIGAGTGASAVRVSVQLVSGQYFTMLGAPMRIGRAIDAADDRPPAGERVAVLGYGFWQRQFGGRTDALGKSLTLGVDHYEIVGVAAEGFTGTGLTPVDAWVPIAGAEPFRFAGGADWYTSTGAQWLTVLGRLRSPADSARATVQATQILRAAVYAKRRDDSLTTIQFAPFLHRKAKITDPDTRLSVLLLAVSICVLLIACANVANLLLARAVRRRQEIAVRVALGAGRARLVRLLLAESVVLAAAGGVGALIIAQWGGAILRSQLLGRAGIVVSSFTDPRILAFTALATVLTAIVTGLAPAWRAGGEGVAPALKAGVREGGGRTHRVRSTLVVVQGGVSILLLFGAGLFIRSLSNVNALRLGIDTRRIVLVDVGLQSVGMHGDQIATTFQQLRDAAAALPGVESASLATSIPFESSASGKLSVPGFDSLPQVADGGPYNNAIDERYFSAMGTRIIRGRGITAEDVREHAHVVVINQSMASLLWPAADPLTKCMIVGDGNQPCSPVVGVVENARRQSVLEGVSLQYFIPLGTEQKWQRESRALFLRTRDGTAPEALRHALQIAVPGLPYLSLSPMQSLLAYDMRPWEMGSRMLALFGGIALLLAAIGLYASINYDVNQGLREIGVRLALGASPAGIQRLVLLRGIRLTVLAAGLGGVLAWIGVRWVKEFLYSESVTDPVVIGVVLATTIVASIVASVVPGRRASRSDPAIILRSE